MAAFKLVARPFARLSFLTCKCLVLSMSLCDSEYHKQDFHRMVNWFHSRQFQTKFKRGLFYWEEHVINMCSTTFFSWIQNCLKKQVKIFFVLFVRCSVSLVTPDDWWDEHSVCVCVCLFVWVHNKVFVSDTNTECAHRSHSLPQGRFE